MVEVQFCSCMIIDHMIVGSVVSVRTLMRTCGPKFCSPVHVITFARCSHGGKQLDFCNICDHDRHPIFPEHGKTTAVLRYHRGFRHDVPSQMQR
jgi:hypothetical protein